MRTFARIINCLLAITALCAIVCAQAKNRTAKQEQTVRIKTELIQVRAVVNDKQGRVVDSLKQEDFELLENGKPQKLEFFSLEMVGNPAGLIAPTAPAKTNDQSTQHTAPVRPDVKPARSIALFVDTQHLSPASLLQVKQTLRRFIDQQLTDQDLVAVIPSGGAVGMFSQFTRDRNVLRLAVEKLAPWRPDDKRSFLSTYLAARVVAGDLAVAKRNGLRSRKSFALPPGLYQARVAVLEVSTQRMGSAVAWVEVPKPEPKKLQVSGLLLAEKIGGDPDDQSALHIKQGVRYYRKGDTLIYQLRVSPPANMADPGSNLLVQTQILEGEQTAYQSQWLPLSERLGARDKKGLEIFQEIKLNAATPGVYELRLLIKDPKSDHITARSVLFGIEP